MSLPPPSLGASSGEAAARVWAVRGPTQKFKFAQVRSPRAASRGETRMPTRVVIQMERPNSVIEPFVKHFSLTSVTRSGPQVVSLQLSQRGLKDRVLLSKFFSFVHSVEALKWKIQQLHCNPSSVLLSLKLSACLSSAENQSGRMGAEPEKRQWRREGARANSPPDPGPSLLKASHCHLDTQLGQTWLRRPSRSCDLSSCPFTGLGPLLRRSELASLVMRQLCCVPGLESTLPLRLQ